MTAGRSKRTGIETIGSVAPDLFGASYERPSTRPSGPIGNEETDVLKKTSAYTGLVIVTAAGALLTSSPAYALESLVRGSHSWNHHRSHHRNHNWNGNRHHGRIFIRIYIYNKNNNRAIAVARPEHQRHRRVLVPTDGVVGGGVGAGTGGGAGVGATAADRTPADSTPVASNQDTAPVGATAPVSSGTPADQGTAAAPATTSVAPLDEGATGNVSP
jgi:hypothetical protein